MKHPFFDSPIPIYYSRFTPGITGDWVSWGIGEKAVWVTKSGVRHNVTIRSGPVVHAAAPGKVCREVTFDDEGPDMQAIDAAGLEPPDGWKTL